MIIKLQPGREPHENLNFPLSALQHPPLLKALVRHRGFFPRHKGAFSFGDWVGDPGEDGLLVISAEEGQIVAFGQKDFRQAADSATDYYQVREGNW